MAYGYGVAGEGFAQFGVAEGGNAPVYSGLGMAFPPVYGRPGLSHVTSTANANAINEMAEPTINGTKGVYAVPNAIADLPPVQIRNRTGLPLERTQAAVPIPEVAESAFQVPVPLGPYSMWKALGGVHYTNPGCVKLSTGFVGSSGSPATAAARIYGPDIIIQSAFGVEAVAEYNRYYQVEQQRENSRGIDK
jgi:hypothetical protein